VQNVKLSEEEAGFMLYAKIQNINKDKNKK
jgi:hypothetical protein